MISPQSEKDSQAIVNKLHLTFDILSDPGNQTAEIYRLVFNFPKDLQKVYLQFGIDLSKYNGDDSWRLPLSARYIIDQNQRVRYAETSADYTVRPDPSHTLEALKEIGN